MATKLQLANAALIRLGAEPIAAIDTSSKRSNLIYNTYDIVRKRLIRSHPWNFAVKRVELTLNGNTPAYEYTYEYDLPADCLRIIGSFNNREFKVENNVVLSNEGELFIRYIADIGNGDADGDTVAFDDSFCDAFILALALNISYAMNQSSEQVADIRNELNEALRPIRSYDAQEGTPDAIVVDDWINERL